VPHSRNSVAALAAGTVSGPSYTRPMYRARAFPLNLAGDVCLLRVELSSAPSPARPNQKRQGREREMSRNATSRGTPHLPHPKGHPRAYSNVGRGVRLMRHHGGAVCRAGALRSYPVTHLDLAVLSPAQLRADRNCGERRSPLPAGRKVEFPTKAQTRSGSPSRCW
jgi:hypothetical protein